MKLVSQQRPAVEQPFATSSGYVLMTAAHNEHELIEGTIKGILSQTMLPDAWVIVSDNSTDGTDDIIQSYSKRHSFIRYVRRTRAPGRSFGSKGLAIQEASAILQTLPFTYIGNIDADIALEPNYFSSLIDRFGRNPKLGIAAGFIYEDNGGRFRERSANRLDSVPHGAQLVRRQCYEQIRGYPVLKYGGEDWYAQTYARMNGWEASAFPELRIFHHRHTASGTNLLRGRFCLGRLDHALGSDPLFEIVKCSVRLLEQPLILGAIARLSGFCWSYLAGADRPVSREFIEFLRSEQKAKMSPSEGLRRLASGVRSERYSS